MEEYWSWARQSQMIWMCDTWIESRHIYLVLSQAVIFINSSFLHVLAIFYYYEGLGLMLMSKYFFVSSLLVRPPVKINTAFESSNVAWLVLGNQNRLYLDFPTWVHAAHVIKTVNEHLLSWPLNAQLRGMEVERKEKKMKCWKNLDSFVYSKWFSKIMAGIYCWFKWH